MQFISENQDIVIVTRNNDDKGVKKEDFGHYPKVEQLRERLLPINLLFGVDVWYYRQVKWVRIHIKLLQGLYILVRTIGKWYFFLNGFIFINFRDDVSPFL